MTDATGLAVVIEGQAALRGEVSDGFTAVNTRLDALSGQFDGMGQRMDGLEQKVDGLGQKLDRFIAEQRTMNATMVQLLSGLVGKNADTD
ncbi:hypothetical protein [Streptomyces sp. ISL-100]|uniref:hypothetical protein n=1 Tax=Streptomyces sp. ISL-100 TaxID=2819173 RepID=UPI001BEA9648|nr:hypothetical protein [Streptomyces sp. ISL-100]MBT2401757.1 hypothetical protein [Streptomyces sp. ISL-100]